MISRIHLAIAGAVFALLLSASPGSAATQDSLSVVFPPDRSYVETEVIAVIVNGWPTMIDDVKISVNGMRASLAPRPFNRFVMCYDGIHLRDGMNDLTVTGLQKKKKVREIRLQVFRRSDLSEDSSSAPDGFRKFVFHTRENEKTCSSCHQFDVRKDGDSGPSPCAVCHTKMLSDFQNAHGPSAAGECLMCHDPKSRNPKFGVQQPIAKTCLGCHEAGWEKKKYRHAPTAAGVCTTCHSPHASDEQFFLRKAVVDLCTSCHPDILTRPHVVNSFFSNNGHPLQHRPDPLHPGRILSCVSCHNPHGENSPRFLNNYEESQPLQQFCLQCHKFK